MKKLTYCLLVIGEINENLHTKILYAYNSLKLSVLQ